MKRGSPLLPKRTLTWGLRSGLWDKGTVPIGVGMEDLRCRLASEDWSLCWLTVLPRVVKLGKCARAAIGGEVSENCILRRGTSVHDTDLGLYCWLLGQVHGCIGFSGRRDPCPCYLLANANGVEDQRD